MIDDEDNSSQQQEEEVVKTAQWSSKCFDRPEEHQIILKRFSYAKGTFVPELGPSYIAQAFANENNLTLNAICSEIAAVLKEDEEKMKLRSPRTLVVAVMPSIRFDFVDEFKKQGNFY